MQPEFDAEYGSCIPFKRKSSRFGLWTRRAVAGKHLSLRLAGGSRLLNKVLESTNRLDKGQIPVFHRIVFENVTRSHAYAFRLPWVCRLNERFIGFRVHGLLSVLGKVCPGSSPRP